MWCCMCMCMCMWVLHGNATSHACSSLLLLLWLCSRIPQEPMTAAEGPESMTLSCPMYFTIASSTFRHITSLHVETVQAAQHQVTVQEPSLCNMTTSLAADDPNAYMFKMCSQGYYGPLCSLCLLHNAPPGQQPYGRAGPLECKPCRCASQLHVSCHGLQCGFIEQCSYSSSVISVIAGLVTVCPILPSSLLNSIHDNVVQKGHKTLGTDAMPAFALHV